MNLCALPIMAFLVSSLYNGFKIVARGPRALKSVACCRIRAATTEDTGDTEEQSRIL
jgi:hypothetical protein